MKVEVKEAQSNEVDWTKKPQLVVSKDNDLTIVMAVIQEDESYYFEGVVIGENELFKHGYFDKWNKSNFIPFHGEITLKND